MQCSAQCSSTKTSARQRCRSASAELQWSSPPDVPARNAPSLNCSSAFPLVHVLSGKTSVLARALLIPNLPPLRSAA
jgi:hypothetical protein